VDPLGHTAVRLGHVGNLLQQVLQTLGLLVRAPSLVGLQLGRAFLHGGDFFGRESTVLLGGHRFINYLGSECMKVVSFGSVG